MSESIRLDPDQTDPLDIPPEKVYQLDDFLGDYLLNIGYSQEAVKEITEPTTIIGE